MNGAADMGPELTVYRSGTGTAPSVGRTARQHWPEYLMEGAGLGLFMISAAAITSLLEYPGSPFRQAFPDPVVRRILIGLAMGLTAIGIIYSPWGKRSGAHLNPSVTLTFLRLGKIQPTDAAFYILAQFVGGWIGLVLAASLEATGAFEAWPYAVLAAVAAVSGVLASSLSRRQRQPIGRLLERFRPRRAERRRHL